MDHYIEIRLSPDSEFVATTLMNALVAKLHRGLVSLGSGAVGVGFPDIALESPYGLGERLRLHGDRSELSRLMGFNWMTGMYDHADVSSLLQIPNNVRYRNFFRVQPKSSLERLSRRRSQRHGVTIEVAAKEISEGQIELLELPYLRLTSGSTGQRFPLFVNASELTEAGVAGTFSTYGFSRIATIPCF